MKQFPPFFLWLTIFCSVLSQTFMKYAGMHVAGETGIENRWLLNYWLWFAVMSMGFGLLFWVQSLRLLPLATAYSWTALVYVFTPIVGGYLFGETLDLFYCVGIVCILSGVFVTVNSVQPETPLR